MSDPNLDIALRRFTDTIVATSQTLADRAATSTASTAASAAGAEVDAHAGLRQFVHGVGPLYVAKTKNPSQYVDWTEIVNTPAPSTGGIDPATLELDGRQIATGTVSIGRLPVGEPGASGITTLVRSDDPRLQSRVLTLEASTALYRGRFVTASGNNACGYASATSAATAAVGYIADDYGTGQQAVIWRGGEVFAFLPDQDVSALMEPVYLGADGRVTRTMPLDVIGGVVQQVGVIVGISGTTVRLAVMLGDVMEVQ